MTAPAPPPVPCTPGAPRLEPIGTADLQALARGQPPATRPAALTRGALPPDFAAQRALALQAQPGANRLAGQLYWVMRGEIIVGSCGFKDDAAQRWVEIGYGIAPPCRRQGLGTRAVRALCQHAFDSGLVDAVRACIAPGNRASAALAQRLGFVAGPAVLETDGSRVQVWTLLAVDLPTVGDIRPP